MFCLIFWYLFVVCAFVDFSSKCEEAAISGTICFLSLFCAGNVFEDIQIIIFREHIKENRRFLLQRKICTIYIIFMWIYLSYEIEWHANPMTIDILQNFFASTSYPDYLISIALPAQLKHRLYLKYNSNTSFNKFLSNFSKHLKLAYIAFNFYRFVTRHVITTCNDGLATTKFP